MRRIGVWMTVWAPLTILLFPLAASAALVTCGIPTSEAPGSTAYNIAATSCGLCDLGILIQNIINYLVGLSIPVAIGLFAWAGILYFTAAGDTHKISNAHNIFRSVFIGFVIVLSGWLVVQTVLNSLVGENFFKDVGGNWNTLKCAQGTERPRSGTVSDIFKGLQAPPSAQSTGGTPTIQTK